MWNKDILKLTKSEYYSEIYDWTVCKEKLHNSSKIEKKIYQKKISIKLWQIWWYNVWINIWKEIWKTEPFLRPCIVINNKMWTGLIWIFQFIDEQIIIKVFYINLIIKINID